MTYEYSKLKFISKFPGKGEKIIYSFDPDEENKLFIERHYSSFEEGSNLDKVDSIIFSINSYEIEQITSLPFSIQKLSGLKSLTIPIDWLGNLIIPKKVESLLLRSPTYSFEDKQEFPENLILDNLKYLSVPELVQPYKFRTANFKNLNWIEFDLQAEKTDSILKHISNLNKLKHLIFSNAKNLDVFSFFLQHQIESIELFSCTGKKFPIERISSLKNLKYIHINNINVPFDCKLILELPELLGLSLLNIKNVINAREILEHENLKNLSIKYCNNPFKEIEKKEFLSNKFDHLSINYA